MSKKPFKFWNVSYAVKKAKIEIQIKSLAACNLQMEFFPCHYKMLHIAGHHCCCIAADIYMTDHVISLSNKKFNELLRRSAQYSFLVKKTERFSVENIFQVSHEINVCSHWFLTGAKIITSKRKRTVQCLYANLLFLIRNALINHFLIEKALMGIS